MQLAAVTTTLIDVTHQLACLAAVLRVLQSSKERERFEEDFTHTGHTDIEIV